MYFRLPKWLWSLSFCFGRQEKFSSVNKPLPLVKKSVKSYSTLYFSKFLRVDTTWTFKLRTQYTIASPKDLKRGQGENTGQAASAGFSFARALGQDETQGSSIGLERFSTLRRMGAQALTASKGRRPRTSASCSRGQVADSLAELQGGSTPLPGKNLYFAS